MSAPLLELDGLSLRFDGPAGSLHVLESVSLAVAEGESVGLVGESGSGKSVLARAVLGVHPGPAAPSLTGRILLEGRDVTDGSSRRRAVSMVFQDPSASLNPVVRIGRQVLEAVPPAERGSRARQRAAATELLRAVGLPDPGRRLRSYPAELSGGQRQRVGIAAALAAQPRLLLADEPTTALDVTVQQRVLDLIGELRRERGMALLLITHDLGLLAGRTDRIAVMYAGRVVEDGPTERVLAEPRHPYTRALLAVTPRLSPRRRPPLPQIPGGLPDLREPRTGCPFAPRCERALPECATRPPLLRAGAGHTVSCWAAEGVPV
ncbi:ABC transporter ATP-binding protein [Allonocardiopsis opalescens]|uniref:Peptide/nickel transport system ATP-binding protein n=1 Tax=Allonocardiopsis opalescens TaxID=1144618 RepID=A0A2T0Q9A2_9ACTN|nr:ABC transporter ATP-binding protein [Allonocardiopsis opalescens]PRY00466.1 peptide/nickel transport system ATP-binding protein [Allonocardiopsis opalescens]